MKYFTPDQKHHILIHLQARRKGVNPDDIAHQHGVAGGRRTLNRWLAQWNGTPQSLERKAGSGRPRRLSRAQVTRHLKPRILAANRRAEPIHYPTLLPAITAATGKALSLQTLRRYGKKQLKLYPFCNSSPVSVELCDSIAKIRRKLQRISKERVLFLDETAVRLSEAPSSTLVLPDQQPYVLATETSSYAKRFDMIACLNGNQAFAPCIYTPKDRSDAGVKGINTEMLVDYILNTLGQETWALDKPPLTLVVDKARIHNEDRIMEAFQERGGHVMHLLKLPPMAAKRPSPLDNCLFHDWKEAIRRHGPMTLRNVEQVMADEWNNIKKDKIQAHYKHCGLNSCSDAYFDCPHPDTHRHRR